MKKKKENYFKSESEKIYGEVKGPYNQKSIKKRIEALFLDNLGKILLREQIIEAARDPITQKDPENWHQRVSELRTDDGYTILSWRNRGDLKVQEYLMPNSEKRQRINRRVRPHDKVCLQILEKANYSCEWDEDGTRCGLEDGQIDPIGGGTVKLTPDHKSPHSMNVETDPGDPNQWRVLCGRHQVMKKNFWDDSTGKINVYAIVQAASEQEKRIVFSFLIDYFGYQVDGEKLERS